MSEERCGTCRFMCGQVVAHFCRRFPPDGQSSTYPSVPLIGWCGEYQPVSLPVVEEVKEEEPEPTPTPRSHRIVEDVLGFLTQHPCRAFSPREIWIKIPDCLLTEVEQACGALNDNYDEDVYLVRGRYIYIAGDDDA